MKKLFATGLLGLSLLGPVPAGAQGGTPEAALPPVTVYKSPWCGCCGGWVEHMRANGFEVTVHDLEDLAPVKASAGVGDDLMSCHTALVAGYTIEGHVPASDVIRLLDSGRAARGLSVPGMVAGSPGMGEGDDPYQVILFTDAGGRELFATH